MTDGILHEQSADEEKILYFIIKEKEIYLEEVLVDFQDIPIFFLCKDKNGQDYLALYTGKTLEDPRYIVVELSKKDVSDLLDGKLPMRDVILKQDKYWDVESSEEISNDIVIRHTMRKINKDDLPDKGAYYKKF